VARCLGDADCKGLVSPEPDVSFHELPANSMVIIGSDGLWDGISLRGAAAIAARNHSTLETANRLIESALKFFGLFDDMTCGALARGAS